LLAVSSVKADEWALKPEVKELTFLFGRARIVLHYDSTQNIAYPKYTLKIYEDAELLTQHEGIGFERLFASSGNDYFLGVSNSGLINDAFVVFDRRGKVISREPHDSRDIYYCTMSISLVRMWYDESNPGVEFNVVDGRLVEVSIKACDGKRLSLLGRSEGTSQPGHPADHQ